MKKIIALLILLICNASFAQMLIQSSGPIDICGYGGNPDTLYVVSPQAGYSYTWYMGGYGCPTGPSFVYGSGRSMHALITGEYYCIGTSSSGSQISNPIRIRNLPGMPGSPLMPAPGLYTGNNYCVSFGSLCIPDIYFQNWPGTIIRWYKNNILITGVNSGTYTTTHSGYYKYSITSWCMTAWSDSTLVTTLPAGSITANGPTTFCSPGSVILNADQDIGLSYQWRVNGGNISGATSSSFTATSSGNYDCVESNSCGSTPSNTVVITADILPSAVITASGSTSFCTPGSVLLNVTTCSSCTYQWRNNSLNISGANASSYTAYSGGNYDCIVTNSCGSRTSNAIPVAVNSMPVVSITAVGPTTFCHQYSQSPYSTGSVSLTASATGGNLSYQWRNGNNNISGATSTSYVATTSGSYNCLVTNTCGTVASNSISVTALPGPSNMIYPLGDTTCWPQSVSFSVSCCYTSYQWYDQMGLPISGQTSNWFYTIYPGTYYCVLYDGTCYSTTNTVTVTVYYPPTASITAGGSTTFCSPGSVTLNANTGTGLSYQWRLNNGNVSGATSASYVATTGGNYDCIVTNLCGSATSNSISVTINSLPSAVITAGGTTTFCSPGSVILNANTGSGLSYQWRLNSGNISGATSASYAATASGSYDCVVSNTCGSTTSNIISVTVDSVPSASITAGGPTTFCSPGSVTMNANTGFGLSYQWRNNSVNISGATSASYVATASGNYSCVVTNTCGSTTSNSISVTVNSPPSAVITAGGTTTFCSPGSVTLNANTGSGLSYQWRWNNGNISGATSASYVATTGGSYSCVVTNSCGSSTSNSITVTVNSVPAAPGSITGQTSGVCASLKTYSISAVANATGYTWSVPSGATLSSGQGTVSINVTYTNSFTSGVVSVVASNACGNSGTSSITVTGVPAQPGNISGPISVCHNQNNVIYSIAAVTGATSDTWTVPTGAQIKTGQGTVQIKVRFGNSAGNITVRANNSCGSSAVRTLAITMPCREGEKFSVEEFSVNVFPNPSGNDFTFVINTFGTNSCSINIFDLTGRVVETHQNISANNDFKCGVELTDGIYYAEIISGNERKILKLIKQQ